jgi:hypothetical protein
MKIFIYILLLLLSFGLFGCNTNTPKIETPKIYTYQYDKESDEIVVKKIENTNFSFVKRGNVYYIVKNKKDK